MITKKYKIKSEIELSIKPSVNYIIFYNILEKICTNTTQNDLNNTVFISIYNSTESNVWY